MSIGYVICTNPRSGSTLLCKGLAHTGRAGIPEEYFDHRDDVAAYWRHHYAIPTDCDFVDGVARATSTPNGVFGAKLHWVTRVALVRALRESLGRRGLDVGHRTMDDLLHARFRQVRYIWLRRGNKVAQGISHYRATRTDVWELPNSRDRQTAIGDASVDFEFRWIDHCIARATKSDLAWEAYFVRHGLAPLEVVYEDFVADYRRTLRKVLAFLGVPHADLEGIEPRLERLADTRSLEWEARYREMKAELAREDPEPGTPDGSDRAARE
jgi:trehalose 2-sulfotransferase